MDETQLMEQVLQLQEQLELKDQAIADLNNKVSAFDEERSAFEAEKNKLKQTNMDLFLKVSQPIEPAAPVEPQPTELSWDEIVSKI